MAASERRTALALNAYFYGNIPLLGLVAMAAGVLRTVLASTRADAGAGSAAATVSQAALLAAGAALLLAGIVIIRRQLGLGPIRLRPTAAVAALATTAVGVAAGLEAQLIVVAAVLVVPLTAEPR